MLQFDRDAVGYCGRLFDRYGKVAMLVKGAKSNLYSPLDKCPGTVLAYGPEATRAASTQDEQRDDLQSLAGITCHSLSYSLGSNCAVVEQNPSGCSPATAFGRQVSHVQIVSPRPDYADHARQINNAWHNPLPKITLINAIYSKASPARLP
jgi:hypothetical protein